MPSNFSTNGGSKLSNELSYFDQQMALRRTEKAAKREASTRAERELAQLEASTEAIEKGTSSIGNWLLLGVGLALMPVTFGASVLLSIYAGIRMSGGSHMVTDALPQRNDLANPKWGCIRVLASLVSIVLLIVAVAFVALLVAFEMGVIG